MAITLSEMLKKAKDRGIQSTSDVKDKPWYDGSVLKEKDNKPTTNRQQINNDAKGKNKQQTANERTTNSKQAAQSSQQQTNNKIVDAIVENQHLFEDLVGLQRVLFAYIVSACVENSLPKTKPIFVSDFTFIAEADIKTVKTSLYRLEKKQAIYREKFKSGRGGWTIYGLPQKTWEKINEILG